MLASLPQVPVTTTVMNKAYSTQNPLPIHSGSSKSVIEQASEIPNSSNNVGDSTMTNQTINGTPLVAVSPNNPCPFLRMLVANGELPDGEVSLDHVNTAIQKIVAVQDLPSQPVPASAIKVIAATANGLSPRQVAHNVRHGVTLSNLRYHIFDKQGSGTRILDEHANFVPSEMARLVSFGSPKLDNDGNTEIGLNATEIQTMLDDNYARAKGHRRIIDRRLMDGELPIVLKVIGKQGKNERYLSVADIELLFKERRLPDRLLIRLAAQH